jgi:hypothetical protein
MPVGAAFRALARPSEFRAIAATLAIAVTAGSIKLGTVLARAIEFGPLSERTIARRTIVTRTREARTILAAAFALLPGLVGTAVTAAKILARAFAEILAWPTIRRTPRKFPLAVEFAFGALTARRAITAIEIRAVSAWLEAALATILARPAIRPAPRKLPLTVELAFRAVATRRVGLLVAKLSVAGPTGGTGIVAIPARRTVVTAEGRTITTRLEWPLLAIARGALGERTVLTRLEGTVATRLEAALATILAARPVFAVEFRTVAEVAARGIALRAGAERAIPAVGARRAAVAVATGRAAVALALDAALGELLLGAARLAGTALGRSL